MCVPRQNVDEFVSVQRRVRHRRDIELVIEGESRFAKEGCEQLPAGLVDLELCASCCV